MTDEIKDTPIEGEKIEEKKEPLKEAKEDKAWTRIVEGKYKTEEELAAAYKDLEKEYGRQSEEVRQAKEFAEVVQPLLEEIRNDPELFALIDKKLKGKTDAKPDKKDDKTTVQADVRDAAFDIMVARFEEKHGIDKLSEKEANDIRKKIGTISADMTGQSLDKIDLRRINNVLENAFLIANKDKLIEKSKLEALMTAQGISEAEIPSVPSSSGKTEETLTSEETRIAGKMGLTREQYLEGKKKSGR